MKHISIKKIGFRLFVGSWSLGFETVSGMMTSALHRAPPRAPLMTSQPSPKKPLRTTYAYRNYLNAGALQARNNSSERFTKAFLRTTGLKLILLSIDQPFSASSGNFRTISVAQNRFIFDPNSFLRVQLLNLY